MKTTPKALNSVLEALNADPVNTGKTVDALNAISGALGGDTDATVIPDAIENIAVNASGGGGGDSDFTTCIMTHRGVITSALSEDVACAYTCPYFLDADDLPPGVTTNDKVLVASMNLYFPQGTAETTEITYSLPLYKGETYLEDTNSALIDHSASLSGNIERIGSLTLYKITGDCTITYDLSE